VAREFARGVAEASARSSDRRFWPTLSLGARADYEYPHAMKVEWGPAVQGGVTLSWELFDGGLRQAQTAEARANARGAAEQARAAEQSLVRRLVDVEARARTAQADLVSARETLEQQEVYLRVARASVQAGTGTELDVHNAELGVDRARIAVQQALFGKAMARAEGLMVHGVALEQGGSR
jgi:outer membrane protein TolC